MAATLCAAAFGTNLLHLVPLFVGAVAPPAIGRGPPLRITHFNVNTERGQPRAILERLRAMDSELVFLLEIGPDWLPLLEGLESPYRLVLARPSMDNFGIALIARVPIRDVRVVNHTLYSIPTIEADVPWDGEDWLVIGVHTLPPIGADMTDARDAELEAVAARVRPEQRPVAIVGDLNATRWSPVFPRLLETSRLVDAGRGRGYQPTWVSPLPLLELPIDHCLHSADLAATALTVHAERLGSDHRPVTVALIRTGAAEAEPPSTD